MRALETAGYSAASLEAAAENETTSTPSTCRSAPSARAEAASFTHPWFHAVSGPSNINSTDNSHAELLV